MAGTITGNSDKVTMAELVPEVWPIVREVRDRQRADALAAMDAAMGEGKVVSTLEEVWRLAQDGRGKLLLVEKGYHVSAVVDEKGGLQVVAKPGGTEVMDDAVDEIIEAVLAKGGEVMIVDDNALADHNHIALTLRY